ncbi:D-amino-acid transaminase [Sporomusa acidovorans]|uniref:D-alanine aminotransferase n=1 Tax=Sporomusa acidovorans (strain ATCC 49682 / DSM 3132 / Mol) TaxID=1123286 RepID=A0ABZ3J598_SPOA4|nr:D-amino-acid transaminase [Sporomusa acidovorans]OZC15481.1 D-alanine aminotransferase [Sporomusa acidovorans DSM 3132]SDE15792.1 D-alanine transaminase [Sporomusa acidovorans]
MKPIGLLDGKIIDLQENIVPMEDRGHQFGDGVYEVTKVYNGYCFALKLHLDRLYRSLRELTIPAVYTYEELVEFHALLIKESGIKDGAIYLQITRGVSPRAHGFPEQVVPRLTMSIRPVSAVPDKNKVEGAKGLLIPDERWLRCDIKSLNLLGNVLGKQKAKDAGCFEGIQVRDGIVTEGTSSNFFVIKDDVLWTHPTCNLILTGVTRTLVIEKIAPELGLIVVEKKFDEEFAKSAQETFVSGTSSEITPIIALNGQPVGNGSVGPITHKIQDAYWKLIDEECKRK